MSAKIAIGCSSSLPRSSLPRMDTTRARSPSSASLISTERVERGERLLGVGERGERRRQQHARAKRGDLGFDRVGDGLQPVAHRRQVENVDRGNQIVDRAPHRADDRVDDRLQPAAQRVEQRRDKLRQAAGRRDLKQIGDEPGEAAIERAETDWSQNVARQAPKRRERRASGGDALRHGVDFCEPFGAEIAGCLVRSREKLLVAAPRRAHCGQLGQRPIDRQRCFELEPGRSRRQRGDRRGQRGEPRPHPVGKRRGVARRHRRGGRRDSGADRAGPLLERRRRRPARFDPAGNAGERIGRRRPRRGSEPGRRAAHRESRAAARRRVARENPARRPSGRARGR